MKKWISIVIALLLIFNPCTVLAKDELGVAAAPNLPDSYTEGMDQAEKILAQAIYTGYKNVAPSMKEKVAASVRPKLEAIGKKVYAMMEQNKASFDQITYRKNDLSSILSQIPPEQAVNSIPAEMLGQIKAQVRQEVLAGIQSNFERIPGEVDTAVRSSLSNISPSILAEIKPMIKAIIFETGDLIDESINDSIDAEITKVLPQVIELLPDEMDGLEPAEIAEKYRVKMEPAAQAALRPEMEKEVKAVIDAQVEELIEKPITALMDPKIDQIDDAAVYNILEQIPSYVNRIISNDEIRALVTEEIAKLKAKLPAMIAAEQADMKTAIREEIEKFIDDNTKLYIDGKLANIKVKIMNNKAFISYTDIKKAIGGKVVYSTKKKSITITNGKKTLEFTLGSIDIKVNGKVVKNALKGDEVPVMSGSIPSLPMKFIAEQFGYTYDYNSDWGMTKIENKK